MDILTDIARHLPQQTQDRLSAMKLTNKTYDQDSATTMIAAFDPELTVRSPLPAFRLRLSTPSITAYPGRKFEAHAVPYLHDCQPAAPKDYASDRGLLEADVEPDISWSKEQVIKRGRAKLVQSYNFFEEQPQKIFPLEQSLDVKEMKPLVFDQNFHDEYRFPDGAPTSNIDWTCRDGNLDDQ